MKITKENFKIKDKPGDCLKFVLPNSFFGNHTVELRNHVFDTSNKGFDQVYIDATKVEKIDLSGINEIIHVNHQLHQDDKELILLYKKTSILEEWIESTSMDKFVTIAVIP
ncbi:hypothetical protein [Echinicola sp. 20G]|uniref:hypothetical protein n=1 Tax=Echinicola sp. 20G TaxID=2781961 RepID=UPI001F3B56E2|nr:hypothetical protein [Echinicola sp. 20G]